MDTRAKPPPPPRQKARSLSVGGAFAAAEDEAQGFGGATPPVRPASVLLPPTSTRLASPQAPKSRSLSMSPRQRRGGRHGRTDSNIPRAAVGLGSLPVERSDAVVNRDDDDQASVAAAVLQTNPKRVIPCRICTTPRWADAIFCIFCGQKFALERIGSPVTNVRTMGDSKGAAGRHSEFPATTTNSTSDDNTRRSGSSIKMLQLSTVAARGSTSSSVGGGGGQVSWSQQNSQSRHSSHHVSSEGKGSSPRLAPESKGGRARAPGFAGLLSTSALRLPRGGVYPIARLAQDADIVGLYFSAVSSGPCRRFSPLLERVYKELLLGCERFEIVMVSMDDTRAAYDAQRRMYPWPALDFGLSAVKMRLIKRFKVWRTPTLILINSRGRVVCAQGRKVILVHKAKGFPYTAERIAQISGK